MKIYGQLDLYIYESQFLIKRSHAYANNDRSSSSGLIYQKYQSIIPQHDQGGHTSGAIPSTFN